MTMIEILVPELSDPAPPKGVQLAVRKPFAEHARITIVENGKPKAKELLELVVEGLSARFPIEQVTVYSKGSASRVLDDEEIASIAASSDAVIAGVGDCGACSAYSLTDAIKMEIAGVPATVLISDVFIGNVATFAAALGLPGYHSAVVPHPVASRTPDELRAYANSVLDQIELQLIGTRTEDAVHVSVA